MAPLAVPLPVEILCYRKAILKLTPKTSAVIASDLWKPFDPLTLPSEGDGSTRYSGGNATSSLTSCLFHAEAHRYRPEGEWSWLSYAAVPSDSSNGAAIALYRGR